MKYFILILLSFYTIALFAQDKVSIKKETGKATYYGKKFNNRKTASGIMYKSDNMVCAHRTYPFGTKLLVRNLKNNKEVVVEVIDRGPFKKGRIIDLSYAAAKKIDMVHHGVVRVEVSEYSDSIDTSVANDSVTIIPQ